MGPSELDIYRGENSSPNNNKSETKYGGSWRAIARKPSPFLLFLSARLDTKLPGVCLVTRQWEFRVSPKPPKTIEITYC
jgi:hypothetical protein